MLGTHEWPQAPPDVGYLRSPHRHRFVIHVTCDVSHGNRAVEFHTLALQVHNYMLRRFGGGAAFPGLLQFGARSCEMIAALLLVEFGARRVEVSEDGEHTGTAERQD